MGRMGRPRKPAGARLVRTGIALPPEMHKALRELAGPDMTVSQKIRQLLREGIAGAASKPEAAA